MNRNKFVMKTFCPLIPMLCLLSLGATRLGAALAVSTNFESGSARVLAADPDTQTIRIMPAGDPQRGWPCWWYLRVDGIDTAKPLTLEVVASSAIVPAHGPKKAGRLAAAWSFPERATFSTNGTRWAHTPPGERRGNTAVYRMTAGSGTIWLAWGPPFTPKDAETFVERTAQTHPFAKAFILARSREGRPAPALQFSEGEKPAARRPSIWVVARQHAWEAGGTWVGVGFAEWLASGDERAQWLRENAEIFFVPIMDVDRVATGDGGKESLPQDHNFDWSNAPHWPEVAAVQKRVLALKQEGRMSLLVDLHNPGASAREIDLWITPTNLVGALAAQNQQRFADALRREVVEPIPVKTEPHWDGPGKDPYWQAAWHELTCPWVYEHANPSTVAITMETPWNTPASTTDGYRAVGRGLGQAIERFLRQGAPWPADTKRR